MKLETGEEKRFFDFISTTRDKKAALISHTDLDGITAAKIVNQVIKADEIKFVDYTDLNKELTEELREKRFERIIFTDLYIKDEKFIKELESFAEVLIIDHHLSPDWNSKKTIFIKGKEGYSAGYLCYYLFSKIKNLESWDWLVACSCISDYCHIKPREWLGKVFEKYRDNSKVEDLYKEKRGKFWELQYKFSLALIYFKDNLKEVYDSIGESFGDMGNLGEHAEEIQADINRNLKEFEKKKEKFDLGWFYETKPKFEIKSILSNILSNSEPDKVFVIVIPHGDSYNISVRKQGKKFDCSKFLQALLKGLENADGGGHMPAAGGHFMKKDLPEFRRRLGL